MALYLQLRAMQKTIREQLERCHDTQQRQKSPAFVNSGSISLPVSHEMKYDYSKLEGVEQILQADSGPFFQVSWNSAQDEQNPRNWSFSRRFATMILLDLVAAVVTSASSIDAAIAPQAAEDLQVSETIEAFGGTGVFLIGFGIGSFVAAPLSEMVGRMPVYLVALTVAACFLVGSSLAANITTYIICRFIAGIFSSAPLTVAGGSMNDLWNTREMTWAFPLFAVIGFGGPLLSIVIASYIGSNISWRWAEWITIALYVMVLTAVVLFMRETSPTRLLDLKAAYLRQTTKDDRFRSSNDSLKQDTKAMILQNLTRPWIMAKEPIVYLFTLYSTISYAIFFSFLVSYSFIFEEIYGISQGLKNICFLGLFLGILLIAGGIPLVLSITYQQLKQANDDGSGQNLQPEIRLLFAMIGSFTIPMGLFWMGWTARASISIWSPLSASVLVGFGMVCIFVSTYTYIIDSYQHYAASALTFATFARYMAAGVMTVVSVPMYTKLGVSWSLTLLGILSAIMVPVPFLFYRYGHLVRKHSKYAITKQ